MCNLFLGGIERWIEQITDNGDGEGGRGSETESTNGNRERQRDRKRTKDKEENITRPDGKGEDYKVDEGDGRNLRLNR